MTPDEFTTTDVKPDEPVELTENQGSDALLVTPLLEPSAGTPPVIDTLPAFDAAVTELARGHGPFAVDAERASGYRFSNRAYLIQIKRNGGGLHLIDPLPFSSDDFARLNELLQSDEVILHASTQDLPCLRDVGIHPKKLFDTELGARIAGFARVGLGPLLESLLHVGLAKEHSAVDWSSRPLPREWLTYAALDVDLLIELREMIALSLEKQKKLTWALQDFQAILDAAPQPPRIDPWRRTSGAHKIRKREQLALVRELWTSRARLAEELDIAQGRLLSDQAIVELALAAPLTKKGFEKALRPIGLRPRWSERASIWLAAIERGRATKPEDLPELRTKSDGMPPTKIWREKFPDRYAPFTHARAAVAELAHELSIPPENLIAPELIRRVCWKPPAPEASAVASALMEYGARPWQAELISPALAHALTQRAPIETQEGES